MSDKFIFQLSNEMNYTKDGDTGCVSCSLEFDEPGMKYYGDITDLSQMVMNAMINASRNALKRETTEENENEIEKQVSPAPHEIKAMLFAAKEPKFRDIANCFKKICLKTCTLDGSTKIKEALIFKMSSTDWTKLICSYISFFIAPSLFSEQ